VRKLGAILAIQEGHPMTIEFIYAPDDTAKLYLIVRGVTKKAKGLFR